MKIKLLLFQIFLLISLPLMVAGQNESIIGSWEGTLPTHSKTIKIIATFSADSVGKIKGVVDSPEQGLSNLALDNVSFADNLLKFEFKAGGTIYEGKLTADEINGKWSQGGQSATVNFKRVAKTPTPKTSAPNKPQTPQPPFPYKSEEIVFENKKANVKLAGTLTIPNSSRPVPAVILLTVAGPNDRDMSNGGHKHFAVLADFLTRQGIAVLRYDDRGVGKSTGDLFQSTISDFADDALAGIEFLKSRSEIDKQKIGLVGNSEGGAVAPLAATRSTDVAFVVMLAGPGITGAEIIKTQTQTLAKSQGLSAKETAKILALGNKVFQILATEKDDEKAKVLLRKLAKENPITPVLGANLLGTNDLEAQIKLYVSPWYRYQISYDPKTVLAKVKCPILVMNGELDMIINAKQNLQSIQEVLSQNGNPDYTIIHLPRLNHIFQTAKTGSPTEYRTLEETFSPLALKTIANWILVRFE